MSKPYVSAYQRDIIGYLGCSAKDAAMVEDIMRNHVFHSTLDWQTDMQFADGVRQAWIILESDRETFEEYHSKAKQVLIEMMTRSTAPHDQTA